MVVIIICKQNNEYVIKYCSDDNKLVWYSECQYNPDDECSRDSVSYLTIECIGGILKIKCTKPLDEMISRKNKTHLIGFTPLGNGRFAQNATTGLTLQDEFIINVYQKLLQKGKTRKLQKK